MASKRDQAPGQSDVLSPDFLTLYDSCKGFIF